MLCAICDAIYRGDDYVCPDCRRRAQQSLSRDDARHFGGTTQAERWDMLRAQHPRHHSEEAPVVRAGTPEMDAFLRGQGIEVRGSGLRLQPSTTTAPITTKDAS
jgi:hypothetical protein